MITTLQVSSTSRPTELLYLAQSEHIIKMVMRLDVGKALLEPESCIIANLNSEKRELKDVQKSSKKKESNLFAKLFMPKV